MIKLKILVENYVRKRGILAEQGLSILVSVDNFKVLFDVGQTEFFSLNAEREGIDLADVDLLFLSHGHYDHTGGVPKFVKINQKAPIYIHPDAFGARYNSCDGKIIGQNIGIPWINELGKKDFARIKKVNFPLKINESIMLSGEINGEDTDSGSFLIRNREGHLEPDCVSDEQFLIIKGQAGIYLLVGCSHGGIVNYIKHAQKLFPQEKIAAVIGGMHLIKKKEEEIHRVVQEIMGLGVEKIVPLHCTGLPAVCEMKRVMKDRCVLLAASDELILE